MCFTISADARRFVASRLSRRPPAEGMNRPLSKEDAMSHYPSSPAGPERPGLGRVVISIVGALVVLVAVGVAVVQIGSNGGDQAPSSITRQSTSSPRNALASDGMNSGIDGRAPGHRSDASFDSSGASAANGPNGGADSAQPSPVLEIPPEPMSYSEAERL